MQKSLSITDFAKAGLNTDIAPWSLPGDFLTNIRNIRIENGKLVPAGGYSIWGVLPVDFEPGYLISTDSESGVFWIIPGKDSVYAYDGAVFHDITSVAFLGSLDEDKWQGCLVADIPIINHQNWYPEYWPQQSGATKLELLPWDSTRTWKDANESCKIMRSHKQFLFALDINSNGVSTRDGVRWSAPADIGGVPPTWDHLDFTSTAGLTTLGGDGGAIVDGLSLRDAFVVYRKRGVTVFDYIGGRFIWQIRHLQSSAGLISKNAVTEVRGRHYYISEGDVLVNDGNTIESLMNNRIKKRFNESFDTDNYRNSYVIKNESYNEIWFCIPEHGHTYPNVAYVYNWEDGSWAVREIPEAPFSSYGEQTSIPLTWGNVGGLWDGALGTWGQSKSTPNDDVVVAIVKPSGPGLSGSIIVVDSNITTGDVPFDSIVERTDFAIDGITKVTTITRMYPHIKGPGKVFVQIGSQDRPGSPIRWKDPVEYDPSIHRKIDTRTTGELHCFKVYSESSSAHWELSGIDIEYAEAGTR